MTKNGIIGLSVGTVALLSGLTFYTHSTFSEHIKQVIALEQSNDAQITLESQTQGLLSSDSQYKITISAEKLQELSQSDNINDALELYVNHKYSSYPLFVASEITLDLTKGSVSEFSTLFPEQTIEHLLSIHTNLLTQSHASEFVIKPTTLVNELGTLTLGKVLTTGNTDLNFSSGDFTFDITKLKLDLNDAGVFNLSDLTSTATISDMDGMVFASESTVALSDLSFVSDVQQTNFSMKKLAIISDSSNLKSDVISGQSVLSIESINIDAPLGTYSVLNTTLDLTVENLDKAGFIALDKASKSGKNASELMDAAQLIFNRGFNGSISKFDTTVNELTLKSNGDFSLPSYVGNNLEQELLPHLMTKFGINYSVTLGNNYADVFPQFSPMLDGMADQGFIKKDAQGNLTTSIKMDKGAITANDKRIR